MITSLTHTLARALIAEPKKYVHILAERENTKYVFYMHESPVDRNIIIVERLVVALRNDHPRSQVKVAMSFPLPNVAF